MNVLVCWLVGWVGEWVGSTQWFGGSVFRCDLFYDAAGCGVVF